MSDLMSLPLLSRSTTPASLTQVSTCPTCSESRNTPRPSTSTSTSLMSSLTASNTRMRRVAFSPRTLTCPRASLTYRPPLPCRTGRSPRPTRARCVLHLGDPEQQMDLNRESVRAPPNRTVFDSHPIDLSNSCLQSSLQAPPPSVNPGLSVFEAQEASRQQNPGAGLEGAPPAYSEVMGHYYHPGSVTPGHRHRTVSHGQLPPSSLVHGLLRPTAQQQGSMNSRKAKEKSQKPQQV
uniref:Prostate transmembrane protein, androgen induced 1 n=1 Tax=Cynoglossus semilaevis TaxID=244447 RepID=A0A3P8WXK4_CYNSE